MFYKGEVIAQRIFTGKEFEFIPTYCTMTVTTRRLKNGDLIKTLEAQSRIHFEKEVQALNCWDVGFSDCYVAFDGRCLLASYT